MDDVFIISTRKIKHPVNKNYKEETVEPFTIEIKVCPRTPSRPRYDADILKEMLMRSKRFKNLKPTALSQIIGKPTNFEYIKKIAVERLQENFRIQCALFSQIMSPKEGSREAMQTESLSQGVFSWKWSDFLERRKQQSFVCVDILLRKKEHHVQRIKFQSDMKELQFLVNKIFQEFFLQNEKKTLDVCKNVEEILNETRKALYILDNLEKQFHANASELHHIVYKEYYLTDARRNSEEKLLKNYLENRICNSHILDPIGIRYQLKWFANLVSQNQQKIKSATKSYEADISHFKELENVESFVNGNCLDYCYSSMELYKNQFNELQNKYDKEVDEMDTRLALLRLQIEKIKEQRNWLSSEIQRFHDEEKIIQEQLENNKDFNKEYQNSGA